MEKLLEIMQFFQNYKRFKIEFTQRKLWKSHSDKLQVRNMFWICIDLIKNS
jgi:hypothetical protein